jgi:UDP-glucuronate 4-epimerase
MNGKPNKHSFTLVTGAAGFIASHLIESLLRQGTPVLGIDNFDPFYPRSIKERNLDALRTVSAETGVPFHFIEQDISALNAGEIETHNIDQVIHLAANAGVRTSLTMAAQYCRTNVLGTLNLLEFCRSHGIGRMLFGSSSSVYGNDTPVPFREEARSDRPLSPYAASKRAAELYCYTYSSLYATTVISLRFFTVYGPRQRPDLAIHTLCKQIAERRPITLFGDGSSSRDYTYVTDTVAGILGALRRAEEIPRGSYEVYNLGNRRPVKLLELVRLLEKNLGASAEIVWKARRPDEPDETCAEISQAQAMLGYAPRIGIEEGIRRFVAWFHEANPRTRKAA